MVTWSGVFPAVTTKLHPDGALDLAETQRSIERLVDGGVSGVIVLPMLGENALMSRQERETVVRGAKEVVQGRVPVLSGLACISTADAISGARDYERWGAEGLMAFPSLGYRTDPAETAGWFRAIGGASGLPIMIYNNPGAYGVDVGPETLQLLVDVPTIVCVKEECGDVRRVTDLFNALGDRFLVFCGLDDLILESIAAGVTGWVSGMANVWPAECVELFDLCTRGEFEVARDLCRILTPAFHLDAHAKLVQHIKLAEHLVYGAPETTRAPRLALTGSERDRVVHIIEETKRALARRALERATVRTLAPA